METITTECWGETYAVRVVPKNPTAEVMSFYEGDTEWRPAGFTLADVGSPKEALRRVLKASIADTVLLPGWETDIEKALRLAVDSEGFPYE